MIEAEELRKNFADSVCQIQDKEKLKKQFVGIKEDAMPDLIRPH